ncbi:MAG: hypothetical protein ACR2GY_05320 [Phycisphaerales bacterium]
MTRSRLIAGLLAMALASPLALAVAPSSDAATMQMRDYRVRTKLRGNTRIEGNSKYLEKDRDRATERRFKAKIQFAPPMSRYTVLLNGRDIGSFQVNFLGVGALKYRTAQFNDDGDWRDMPNNFPRVVEGDRVSVGPVSGIYRED